MTTPNRSTEQSGDRQPTPAFQRAMAQHKAKEKAKRKTPIAAKIVYLIIFSFVALVVYRIATWDQNGDGFASSSREPGYKEFRAANEMIISDNEGVANGNNSEAKEIAEQFSKKIAMMRDLLFTEGKEGFSLSGGNFVTYCAINGPRCVIIVHVPQLRKFTGDAKESMNQIAWITAWNVVSESGVDINELAVGVKGTLQYSAIYTEAFDPTIEEVPEPTHIGKGLTDTNMLYPFFAPAKAKPRATAGEETSAPQSVEPAPELLPSSTGS